MQGSAPAGFRSVAVREDDGGVHFEGPPPLTASANEIASMRTVVFAVRVDGSDQIAV